MEIRYYLRRAFAFAVSLVVVASAATAAAQYMYLDANGDGVHTAADVMPSTGPVTFDVWLKTNENRDGSAAVCAQNPSAEMTINSYSFILRTRNGTVTWGGFVNRIPQFTLSFGADSSTLEYWNGRASGTILPAGAYRLASLQATVESGTPTIEITTSYSRDPRVINGFGCRCDASEYDNTMKLGLDWNDCDGLPFDGVSNDSPVLVQPWPMGVVEGQVLEQDLHASDTEGEPITFSAVSPPSFMTVTTVDPGSGTGKVRLTPGFSDAGSRNVAIRASDGVSYDEKLLYIRVDNGNRAPVFDPIADMSVAPGDTATQAITASDADGDAIRFSLASGPPWVSVVTVSASSGTITLTPPSGIGGIYNVTVDAGDGKNGSQQTIHVTVTGPTHPPAFVTNWGDPLGTLYPSVVAEGGSDVRELYATDPDGVEALRIYMEEGPAFIEVNGTYFYGGYANTWIVIRPKPGDRGDYDAVFAVTDGTSTARAVMPIRVTNGYLGDTSVELTGAPGNPLLDGSSYRVTDWNVDARIQAQDTLTFSYGAFDSTDIEFAPRSRDPWSCSHTERGFIRFVPPTGESLHVGSYEGAAQSADASHPGLNITIGCNQSATVAGSFVVKQLDVRSGHVLSAWITFDALANGSPAPIRGELRYKASSVPLSVYTTGRVRVGVADDVRFAVSAADSGGKSVTLSADLPRGAAFTNGPEPSSGSLTWRPDWDQIGIHRIVFHGASAGGDTGSAYCDFIVQPRNAVTAALDANRMAMLTSNRGAFACDLRDSSRGLLWDGNFGNYYETGHEIASSAGLWLGALVDGVPRVAIGGVSSEFVPGPAPGGQALPFDPRFKNYKIVRSGPNGADWREWPVAQGAPTDGSGNPLALGDATVWSVYNDCDPASHIAPNGSTAPLGVEVRQTSWSTQHEGAIGRTVYLRFEVRNSGSNRLSSAYASIWVNPYADYPVWQSVDVPPTLVPINDLIGCDSTRALAYAYSSTNRVYDPSVALGVTLLHGAVRNPLESDSIPLGATSIRRLMRMPSSSDAIYNVMRGAREDGSPLEDPAGMPVRYEVAGDPVAGSGWVDSLAESSTRKIIVLSTGPFDMAPGETQTIVAAVVVGAANDRLVSITDLRGAVDVVRGVTPVANRPPRLWHGPEPAPYDEGETAQIEFRYYVEDPDGDRLAFTANELPQGAALSSDGNFRWSIGYDQAGLHRLHVTATDPFGGWDSMTVVLDVHNVNRAPIARSGGPYHGIAAAPVNFDGGATNDPDGDSWSATWSFGDGATAEGTAAQHSYGNPGTYIVVLRVSDASLGSSDSTVASIATPIQARAFVGLAGGVVRLASPTPTLTVSVEIEGGDLSPAELQGATFALESPGTGTVASIDAMECRSGGDTDQNGTPELALVFRKNDLRALFCHLPEERTTASLLLMGTTASNMRFAAPIELTIEAALKPLTVVLAPNPINPSGVLTFTTSRAGKASVSLFDVRGRLVRRLYTSDSVLPGYHDVPIDGRDDRGHLLATGLYFYRIEATEGTTSGRIAVLK